MFTRKPSKLQPSTSRDRKSSSTPNTSAESSTSNLTNSKSKRNRRAPDYYGFKSSVCSVSDQESVPMPKRARTTSSVIETVIQEEASKPPLIETSFKLQVVSPPDPRIQPLANKPLDQDYGYADHRQGFRMSVFDAENQILKHFQNTSFNLLD